jgi:4-diphosphocytidyl-2-C-methyl-D-erythritol kinase
MTKVSIGPLPSFAKINWTLEILGKRADGYHELRTLLQTVSLADHLTFTPIDRGIEIICDHPEVPCDETNLVYRAAALLREFAGLSRGVRVSITKRIPTAAGLGGGSSNAAVTLMALAKLWQIEPPPLKLFELGAQLGADVPFFLLGGTCLGAGRGDEVQPVEEVEEEFLLLINAGLLVPTREVYANLPSELTKPCAVDKMPLSLDAGDSGRGVQAGRTGRIWSSLSNDLEVPAIARYPLIGQIKERLKGLGARGVLMSGSGSTVFAIFDSEKARSGALSDLSETGWWCAPARTLSREEYQPAYRHALTTIGA